MSLFKYSRKQNKKPSSITRRLIVAAIILSAIIALVFINFSSPKELLFYIKDALPSNHPVGITEIFEPEKKAPNYSALQNPYIGKQYSPPEGQIFIAISSAAELVSQVKKINAAGTEHVTFLIDDGVYTLEETLNINNDHIMFSSVSGKPEDVIIQGSQYKNTGIEHLFRVTGKYFTIDGITLQNLEFRVSGVKKA